MAKKSITTSKLIKINIHKSKDVFEGILNSISEQLFVHELHKFIPSGTNKNLFILVLSVKIYVTIGNHK